MFKDKDLKVLIPELLYQEKSLHPITPILTPELSTSELAIFDLEILSITSTTSELESSPLLSDQEKSLHLKLELELEPEPLNLETLCNNSINITNQNFNLISDETIDQDSNFLNQESDPIFSDRYEILRITARRNFKQYTEKIINQMLKKRKLIDFKIGNLLGCKYGILNVGYYSSELETFGTITYPELDEIPLNQISI
ncbi:hypothetical protein Glove_20g1 [Diversispora epigaea]|uniref:Uncharacterized protein n=1 Tax=Diversispora epigaea TaxID=1348612 RepID=A0A397JKM7_9GLOM|nr:hypothetical protein Glove_20g1 [Diversispora epigaea]